MRDFKKFVIPIVMATPLALLLAHCSIGSLPPVLIGRKIWLNNNENVLRQEIRNRIPIGSSIVEAKDILQLNGFRCGYHKNSEPVDSTETNLTK